MPLYDKVNIKARRPGARGSSEASLAVYGHAFTYDSLLIVTCATDIIWYFHTLRIHTVGRY